MKNLYSSLTSSHGLSKRQKQFEAPTRFLPLALVSTAALVVTMGMPARASYVAPAEGTKCAVATDNADATRAALSVMQSGGNAFDGAIAAALALGVVQPVSSGLGGGGFAVMYIAKEHKVVAFDFRETAPLHASVDDMVARTKRGASIGVPGEPAGLASISLHYAKKSLLEDAAPAAALATNGFAISRHLNELITRVKPSLVSTPLAPILLPGGTPLPFAQTVKNPDLGKTILRFGSEGAAPFYSGDIAKKIVASAKEAGAVMDANDLAGYKPKDRTPFMRTFGSRTLATMPAPSAGGLMQLEVLSLFGADATSPLRAMGFGSSYYFHMLAEGMRGAIADRARLAGDPDLDPSVNAAFDQALDPAQIAARRARIEPAKTHNAQEYKTREEGTSHLIVTDSDGNVVSLTTTVNGPFGARILAGDTGIILNNELDDFSSPGDVAGFGIVGLGGNRPRAGARPVSSMAPAIVLENGVPIVAVGGSGGRRIATGTTQALVARLIFGLDASACVSSPRFYTAGGEVLVEPEIAEDVRVGLAARGESVKDEVFLGTGVQMITWDRSGGNVRIQAAADPRKQGFSAAF